MRIMLASETRRKQEVRDSLAGGAASELGKSRRRELSLFVVAGSLPTLPAIIGECRVQRNYSRLQLVSAPL